MQKSTNETICSNCRVGTQVQDPVETFIVCSSAYKRGKVVSTSLESVEFFDLPQQMIEMKIVRKFGQVPAQCRFMTTLRECHSKGTEEKIVSKVTDAYQIPNFCGNVSPENITWKP